MLFMYILPKNTQQRVTWKSNLVDFTLQNLHEDWIRKVRYYPSLQCFISCATASNTSMYLGDVERKKTLVTHDNTHLRSSLPLSRFKLYLLIGSMLELNNVHVP